MTTQPSPIPVRPVQPDPASVHVMRAAFAAFKCAALGTAADPADAVAICAELFPGDSVARSFLTRADATVGTTTTSGWAAELAQTATAAFLASLAPVSAAAGLMQRGLSVPLGGYGDAVIPARATAPSALTGVAEGAPIPVRMQTITSATLTPHKVAAIIALTRELARRSSAQQVFETMLREDAAVALDAAYFSTSAESASTHQGLLYGLSTSFWPGDVIGAMAALAASVSASGSGEVVFVTSSGLASVAPMLAPTLRAAFLPSLAVPDGRLIAIDPRSLVHGFGPDAQIYSSAETLLHMSDVPLEIVADDTTVADPTRSMWQTNGIATRIILDIAFAARRTGAVQYADGVQW